MNKSIFSQSPPQPPPPPKPLCNANHPINNIYFCRRCAGQYEIHKSIDRVFFCGSCSGFAEHSKHIGERFSVNTPLFKNCYGQFIESVKLTHRMRFCHFIQEANKPRIIDENQINQTIAIMVALNPPIYANALRPKLDQSPLTLKDFSSLQYRRWITQNKFWDSSNKTAATNVGGKIQEFVKDQFKPAPPPDPWQNFTIDFGPTNTQIDLAAELKGSSGRLAQLGKEKLLTEFFLQVAACFNNEDINKNLQECARIEGQLGAGSTFLLRLGKLKALELHDECSPKMKAVLKEVDPKLLNQREKELFYYYSAVAEWEYVPNPTNSNSLLFVDARNKKHYRLQNPGDFVTYITKAIDISKKPVYLAARALANMALKQNDKAEADFEAAQQLKYSSDAMDSNRLLNTVTRKLEPNQVIFTQDLHDRKTEYIMGLCKVLQKKKKSLQLRRCCEELVYREPRNLAFRVSLLKALLKLKDTDAARHQLSEIKDLKELSTSEIEEFERKIELLKAYEQEQLGNYSDAEGKLEHAARAGQPSSSYWFNYAAFLFKHRNERENNEKALMAINRALEIRVKNEYLELKYMLLFMMGNMEEAAKIQSRMTHPKFNSMKEYVDGNI